MSIAFDRATESRPLSILCSLEAGSIYICTGSACPSGRSERGGGGVVVLALGALASK